MKRQQPTQPIRKQRSDKGNIYMTDRDLAVLTWIGEQYAARLDQVQMLLGRQPGRGATHTDHISESSARDVVNRWRRAGWVHTEKFREHELFWAWLTSLGLRKCGLPYKYFNLSTSRLEELKHLYAINAVRMDLEKEGPTHWISERHLAMGITREKGKQVLHQADAIIHEPDSVIAIEVELTPKSLYRQEEILLELMKGEGYLKLKGAWGKRARQYCRDLKGEYDAVWYFATEKARNKVVQARAKLVREGALTEEEASEIYLYSYPLSDDEATLERDEARDEATLDSL